MERESKQVSGSQVVHYRNYRRARDKALVRLAHLYPDTYKQLLDEQRKFDEQEGKNWSVDSDSRLTVNVRTRANGTPAPSKASSSGRENEGNNGGEA
jgi:hypothetical protein